MAPSEYPKKTAINQTHRMHKGRGFPDGSDGKEPTSSAEDLGLIPGLGKSPGEGTRLPTAVFLPIEFHGPGSLTGYIPCGCKELGNE